jgi:small subunit ribosomal protein S18
MRKRSKRRKICPFCSNDKLELDYKDPKLMSQYITERGKIIPRRISGVCAKHQRELSLNIKRSRQIALIPYLKMD